MNYENEKRLAEAKIKKDFKSIMNNHEEKMSRINIIMENNKNNSI